MLLTQIIRKNIITVALSFALIINTIVIFTTNGPLWGFFCLTFLSLIVSLILGNKIHKKVNQKFFSKIVKKDKKSTKIFKIFIVILILILLTYCLFPFFMIGMSHFRAEANKSELQEVVSSLINDDMTDEEKTLAILEWFDEDNGNIYDQYHLFEKEIHGFQLYPGSSQFVFYGSEPYFGIRSFNDNDAPWIYSSKYGHCGEYSLLFRYMANLAGLKVRKVDCLGENHAWNEVLINNSWIIIDATCHHPQINGYNKSSRFMEKKVGEDISGVTYGNVSFVEAEYLNGDKEDVTNRYTINLTNISILVSDSEGNPVDNVKVSLYSSNRGSLRNTGHFKITNKTGKCIFTIGGGNYTFKVDDVWIPPIYGEISGSYSENQSYHEDKITIGFDWLKITLYVCIGLLIVMLVLNIYLRNKKKKGENKMDNKEKLKLLNQLWQADRDIRGAFIHQTIQIEWLLSDIITAHFSTTKEKHNQLFSMIIEPELTLSKKVHLLEKILDKYYSDLLQSNPNIIKDLESIRDFRNRVAHSNLDTSDNLLEKKYKDKLQYIYYKDGLQKKQMVTIKDFHERLGNCSKVIKILMKIQKEVREKNLQE